MPPTKTRETAPLSPLVKGVLVCVILASIASVFMLVRLSNANHDIDRFSEALETQNERLSAIEKSLKETTAHSRSNQMKIGLLSNQLNQLEAERRRVSTDDGQRPNLSPSADSGRSNRTGSAFQGSHQRPIYARFQINQEGVDVWQDEEGRIIAENSDPALTGKIILVEAEDENGNMSQLTVMLPPPKE